MERKYPDPIIFWVPLSLLQPSQLYINREKLAVLRTAIDFSDPEKVPPIPAKDLDGQWVMTDGHTRALAAYLAGNTTIPVYLDKEDLDWEAYRICVRWCQESGIFSIAGLVDRIISPEQYKKLWLDRCMQMQNRLVENRKT